MKSIFSTTYRQSLNIANSKNIISDNKYEINKSSYLHRVFVVIICFGFILLSWPNFNISIKNINNSYTYIDVASYIKFLNDFTNYTSIIACIVFLLTLMPLLMPAKNIAIIRVRASTMLIAFLLLAITSESQVASEFVIRRGGILINIFQIMFILLAEIINYMIWFCGIKQKLYSSKDSNKKMNIFIGVLILLVIIISITCYLESKNYRMLYLFRMLTTWVVPAIYLLLFECIKLLLNNLLTWHYVGKYPEQYRIYYKIPDDVWYLSKKSAAKHPHVYPPVDKNTRADVINKTHIKED